jgi:hypothetical protein
MHDFRQRTRFSDKGEAMNLDEVSEAPTKDFALMWKVYDHIVEHPEEWNQQFWITGSPCNTAFCFAGHAVWMTEERCQIQWNYKPGRAACHICDADHGDWGCRGGVLAIYPAQRFGYSSLGWHYQRRILDDQQDGRGDD